MIKLEKVNKCFNKKTNKIHVINNVSLTFDKGLVTLLGPSGSGKTTLLNAIGGLIKIDSGKIFINNKNIIKNTDKIRNKYIGYIFQNYYLIDDLTVFENVELVLKMIGIKDKKTITKRVSYVLKKVNMYRYRNRKVDMLSGGERQRVGIARALVKNPAIILADEPTGNLDSKNTIEIMNIIKSISKEKLVILVTHEHNLAKFYASRIIEIEDGKIVSDKLNKHKNDLDYRLDNKIYLKDMKTKNISKNNIELNYYYENNNKIKLTIVEKSNNIYLKCSNKIEIINDNSIELVNDSYKKITKKDYESYDFDLNKLNNKKIKYSSIVNISNILKEGFKKVFKYSFIKKVLLFGFFLSGMFILYSVSNICGVTNIKDEKFVTTNKNYLSIPARKISIDSYLKYENDKNIKYILPGDSIINLNLKYNDYYQTIKAEDKLIGSLSPIEEISEKDIIYGRIPLNNTEIVIDKLSITKMFKSMNASQIGIHSSKDLLGREILIPNLTKFTIVGITDLKSPSIYMNSSLFINILSNIKNLSLIDYNLKKEIINLKEGKYPENDYEVIVNIKNKNEMPLNKQITPGVKLTVVGYFDDKYDSDYYLVNNNTVKYNLINNSSNISVYSNDKKYINTYEKDKKEYISYMKETVTSTIFISGVILFISLIEIFLIMRTSFLSKIKVVGIYRIIGVKKIDIYKMFVGEIFAVTSLASIPGYLFMAYILKQITSITYLKDVYMLNSTILIFSLILIYAFNLIVGLIPVFKVVNKLPINILSRSDID